MSKLIEAVLAKAVSQLGVREVGRSNTGKEVNAYLQRAGCSPGNPWCAAFVYWCLDEGCKAAGVANAMVRTAYCPSVESWGKQHGVYRSSGPQRGDQFLTYSTVDGVYRASHTGLVTEVSGSTVRTIEGNTNDDGSREGYEVCRRSRRVGSGIAFVRWADVLDTAVPETEQTPDAVYVLGKLVGGVFKRAGRNWAPARAFCDLAGVPLVWQPPHVVVGGRELATELRGGRSYCPVGELATAAGLVAVASKGRVQVARRG